MARIDVLPSIEIIRGFKGILDFYVWRGLPCVRAWPRYRPTRQTDASLAAALTFGAIVKAYSLLANQALLAYREDALDQPRTARDIMVTGVFGNLHEASMSDFLDALIIIRDATVALTDLLNALHSIDTDEIVVRVEHSVLPDDAATHTRQLTMLTALQKIDDLQDALESKALDRFLVRGMDQHFSYKQPLVNSRLNIAISGASGYVDSDSPPDGQIWIVHHGAVRNRNTALTGMMASDLRAGVQSRVHTNADALAALAWFSFPCTVLLEHDDVVRFWFLGALATDHCDVQISGSIMTKE